MSTADALVLYAKKAADELTAAASNTQFWIKKAEERQSRIQEQYREINDLRRELEKFTSLLQCVNADDLRKYQHSASRSRTFRLIPADEVKLPNWYIDGMTLEELVMEVDKYKKAYGEASAELLELKEKLEAVKDALA